MSAAICPHCRREINGRDFLTLADVEEKTGFSSVRIEQMVQARSFPSPCSLGEFLSDSWNKRLDGGRLWRTDDVVDWINNQNRKGAAK